MNYEAKGTAIGCLLNIRKLGPHGKSFSTSCNSSALTDAIRYSKQTEARNRVLQNASPPPQSISGKYASPSHRT